MFKSGFLIFIFLKEQLICVRNPDNLPNLYKNLLINNKINLIKNKYNLVNMNSLRYIMIKLGIIYKEIYMIENGMNHLQNYDMKTANLLMQYILETSDIDYVVKNENDNFYIYIIRTTITYLIKLFKIRTQHVKNNPNAKKSKNLKNLNFWKYYDSIKEFKELIILSKYLDVLRELENEIYYKRKICQDSLILKINSMCIKIQDKDINNLDINYLKKQLFLGKLSDSQNYIITKVHKSLPNVFNISILNKVIVELYCYRLLLDSDMFSVCINILRNMSSNPNLFFRNIAMKTQNRPLRTYLLNHLKHSKFKSYLDTKYEKLIKYIDENYSNPSFKVEYNKKSFKILLMKEFKKMKFDKENSMINKNYSINSDLMKNITAQDKKEINDKTDRKSFKNSSITDKSYKKKDNYKTANRYSVMSQQNLNFIEDFLRNIKNSGNENGSSFDLNKEYQLDIFDDFFANYEIDDFGMNKQDISKPPHYLESSFIKLVYHLIFSYFNDNEEKNFIYSNYNKIFDCIHCKTKQTDQEKAKKNPFIPTIKRNHYGYANISMENLKYFNIHDILRLKFDDYIDSYYIKNQTIEFNLKNISFHTKNIFDIKSIFNYINDHYLTNLLTVFMQKLIPTRYFHNNFLDENKVITSDYFSKYHKYFSILNDKMQIFKFNENSFITEIIQTNFIKNGILTEQYETIDINKIKNLIVNSLFPMKQRTYCRYLKFKESLNKIEENERTKRIFFYLNHHKLNVNNCLKRKSIIDSEMDLFIFKTENYYLLQNFIDLNLLNPIILNNYEKINNWQKIIMLTKFNTFANVFEISIENLKIIMKNIDLNKKWDDFNLIFFGSLIFLKQENVINNSFFYENEGLSKLFTRPISIPNILHNHFNNENIAKIKNNKQFLEGKIIDNFCDNNNVFTCQMDISIKDLINNYYKFFKHTNVKEWETRYDNSTINLDDFEILIENGRVIDAYYYFCEKMTNVSQKDINSYLYTICLNNLLNYNVFSAAVTFLYLSNIETKQLKVQIEAANRVILNDLNNLSKNMNTDILNIVNLVKFKNFNKFNRKYFEISEETIPQSLKDIILIYKDIILAFQQFTKPNTILDETNMQSKPILQILRNLEEATWNMESSPSISNNNEGKDISLDSPWHLVSLFCKIHNLHMSLTLLHELGRNNDWIMFLYESQVQECPPQTVLQILHDYFTIETLTTHLKIIIQELVDIKTEEHNTHLTINNNNNSICAENSKTVSKSDFPNNNLLEFVIYNYKIRQTTNTKPNLTNYILDPIYIMNLAENPKEKINKMNLILNESIFFNSKDLIMVSLLFSNFEEDKKFICLSLHLYITIKEIFLSEVKNEGMKTKSKIFMNSIKNLKEIFDNRKKNIKLIDLENIINFLLLNNHSQLLLEALNLFEIYYSFDEFVKFCKCFSDNDFENAFIHLYVFKNSMNIVFQEKYMDDILILIEEEQELHENLSNIKDVHDLILIFFYQVSITVVKNLIELYELDRFKLFKLFEILYLSKWNKKYSYYFKNLCILDNIKGKGKSLNYKSSFNLLVECLIQEKNFNVLSEFIISYEENIEDDTLLYKIVSIIKSFEKNYILYNDEERKQFWDCIENILKESNLHNVSVAKFFFYILETQENKLYIKEQLIIIFKIYSYLSKSSQNLKQNDKLTKFMKNVIGYEIDNNLNENYILQDLQYKIFIIIFSNCKFEKLSKFFNKQEYFEILYIKENFNLLLNGLYEESTAINFNKVSKNFWTKINNESNMTMYSNFSYYDENNSERKLMNFNDSLKISCINLLNLNNQSLSESLCIFYKLEIDQLKKFISYKIFIKDNLSILKRVDFSILINMFQDAISQNYPNNSNISRYLIVKSQENSTCEELDRKLKSCLEYKSIERIVLYELLKLLISSKIELNEERFLSFDNINSEILNQLIECPSQESENLIKYLNKLIDIDDLLAEIIVQKYIENTSKLVSDNLNELNYSKSLFKYVRLFRYPSKLGFVIKQRLINQGFNFEQNSINNISSNENLSDTKKIKTKEVITINNPFNWELIFMGYYSFLSDCHSQLINFNNIIHSLTQHYNLNSFNNIFKFFQFFEENERENEIFYCMNKILFKNQIKNYQKINNYDVFSGSKSEIEFYFKSKNFKKLGEIYVKIAKDYSLIIEEKQKENENKIISKKQQELTILNLYIKAAELFLMDNCVLNYSKVLEDINNLINNNFNDEIDINLEK